MRATYIDGRPIPINPAQQETLDWLATDRNMIPARMTLLAKGEPINDRHALGDLLCETPGVATLTQKTVIDFRGRAATVVGSRLHHLPRSMSAIGLAQREYATA